MVMQVIINELYRFKNICNKNTCDIIIVIFIKIEIMKNVFLENIKKL